MRLSWEIFELEASPVEGHNCSKKIKKEKKRKVKKIPKSLKM